VRHNQRNTGADICCNFGLLLHVYGLVLIL